MSHYKLALFFTFAISFCHANTANNLVKPTGNYGIGYQDIFTLNNNYCPDRIYQSLKNESNFSSNNHKFCHEIALRIYYPTNSKVMLGDKYFQPWMLESNKWYTHFYKLNESETKQLAKNYEISTYTTQNAQPNMSQKFPIVVFMPGSGQSVQTYTNTISDLVSHGYIVVGINSAFASGPLNLADGKIITWLESYNDATRLENLDDLKLILNILQRLPYKLNLQQAMDFKHIALIGHSMGGMNIVNYLKQNPSLKPQATVIMDPGNILESANYPIKSNNIPSLTLWSSYFKQNMHSSIIESKNTYEVVLTPQESNINFSNHENFSDLSTNQYSEPFQIKSLRYGLTTPENFGIGYGNGYEITTIINQYLLNFLDTYLKNKPSKTFNNCQKLTNSLFNCEK